MKIAVLLAGVLLGWNVGVSDSVPAQEETLGKGCCSSHQGESGRCTPDGRSICNDNTVSPTCRC